MRADRVVIFLAADHTGFKKLAGALQLRPIVGQGGLLGLLGRHLLVDRGLLTAGINLHDGLAGLHVRAGCDKDLRDLSFHLRLQNGGIARLQSRQKLGRSLQPAAASPSEPEPEMPASLRAPEQTFCRRPRGKPGSQQRQAIRDGTES